MLPLKTTEETQEEIQEVTADLEHKSNWSALNVIAGKFAQSYFNFFLIIIF